MMYTSSTYKKNSHM